MNAPTPPNTFRTQVLRFHLDPDKIIWTGNKDCDRPLAKNCHAEAQYSRDNGRSWNFLENYVVSCAWAKDVKLDADPTGILCESYRDKIGSQRFFQSDNPLSLVEGSNYFSNKKKLFNDVVGFAKFSEFLIVAQVDTRTYAQSLHSNCRFIALTGETVFGSSSFSRWCDVRDRVVPS
jgi:hypothetical protein